MIMLKIAFRNIFRQKRRTLLTALSMFIGYLLAVISFGWADGTYENIIDIFTRCRMGHIQVHQKEYPDRPSIYNTIPGANRVQQVLEGMKSIDSWAPRLYSAGLGAVGDNTVGVQIIGLHPERESRTTRFDRRVTAGRYFPGRGRRQALIGTGLAEMLAAGVDDEIVIVSQGGDGSVANDFFKIVGIVESGDEVLDRSAFYCRLEDAQELLVMEGWIHEIAITVPSLRDVARVRRAAEKELNDPRLSVQPWQEFAHSFYLAMQNDRDNMWIVLFVIVIVMAVGVLNTVLMSVLERRREYGVLKAVGTKPAQVFRLVLLEVNILSIFSIIVGAALALPINAYLASHGYTLPEPVIYGGMRIDAMMSQLNLRSFLVPGITVWLSALLVTFFPALKAARTEPARAMRIH
jgi:ABC-type lipoprotein release transport system permease subunit